MGLARKIVISLLCCIFLLPNIASNPVYRRRHSCRTNRKKINLCDHPSPFTFIWQIKRTIPSPAAYLFGTIHVPYTKVWDSIPQIAKDAFNSSDRIIFELDLLNDLTHSRLSNCQMLPTGTKLADIVPKELFHRLKHHLEYVKSQIPKWIGKHHSENGLFADQLFRVKTEKWERKRPIWIMMMLNSLTENGIKMQGIPVLDLYLAYEARNLNKEIGAVERAKDQCIPLNRLNITQALFALNQTLLQHENIRRGVLHSSMTTDELIHHYNCGNLNEVIFNRDTSQLPFLRERPQPISLKERQISKQIDDYFRTQLITNRNKRMSKQIMQILDSNQNESLFFAFGAGHFIGNDSIVELLQEGGLDIVHINDHNFRSPSDSNDCDFLAKAQQQQINFPRMSNEESHPRPSSGYPTDRSNRAFYRNPFPQQSSSIGHSSSSNFDHVNQLMQNFESLSRQQIPSTSVIKPPPPSISSSSSSVISDEPSVIFPIHAVPYGQNPWQNSFGYPAAPRYLHFLSNSSSRLSFNDLLLRAYISSNNNNAAGAAASLPNHWMMDKQRRTHAPAYRRDTYLSSSSHTRGAHHFWPPPSLPIVSANCRPETSAINICLLGVPFVLTLAFLSLHFTK